MLRVLTRQGERTFVRVSAVVLTLSILHHLLMTTLGHAFVMGSLRDNGMITPYAQPAAMLDVRNPGTSAEGRLPSTPMPLMGDCPAQQAVFPLLLLLALLLGLALSTSTQERREDVARRLRLPREMVPPLMPPQQRRALLQVFII